jgi:multisubunit Na+/H+ antiporter MnhG subunit
VQWRLKANYACPVVFCASHEISPCHYFGIVFCLFGIGSLLTALLNPQPWYVRYIQVALALTFIALGILIPLSLHRLGYGW